MLHQVGVSFDFGSSFCLQDYTLCMCVLFCIMGVCLLEQIEMLSASQQVHHNVFKANSVSNEVDEEFPYGTWLGLCRITLLTTLY